MPRLVVTLSSSMLKSLWGKRRRKKNLPLPNPLLLRLPLHLHRLKLPLHNLSWRLNQHPLNRRQRFMIWLSAFVRDVETITQKNHWSNSHTVTVGFVVLNLMEVSLRVVSNIQAVKGPTFVLFSWQKQLISTVLPLNKWLFPPFSCFLFVCWLARILKFTLSQFLLPFGRRTHFTSRKKLSPSYI